MAPEDSHHTSTDFFVSYTKSDHAWAEWVAWQLEESGYTTVIQAWDFSAGSNFVLDMHAAAALAERTIIILSNEYLQSAYAASEWAAAFSADPSGKTRKLVPVRVAPCEPQGLLGQIVYIDLIDLDEASALKRLLARVRNARGKPAAAPGFPGASPRHQQAPKPYPGKADSAPAAEARRRRRFVHAKLTAHGLLDLTPALSPYAALRDATDLEDAREHPASIFAFLWFPTAQYIRSSPLQAFTPAAAICVSDPARTAERLKTTLEGRVGLSDLPPSRMRNEEKEDALVAVAAALQESFVAVVMVPDLVIAAARRRPDLAYQTMINLFVLPLVETHRRLDFAQFHARLASVGDATADLIRAMKRALSASYVRKGSSSVELVPDEQRDLQRLFWAARMIAWSVGAFYNSDNDKWVAVLDHEMNAGMK